MQDRTRSEELLVEYNRALTPSGGEEEVDLKIALAQNIGLQVV